MAQDFSNNINDQLKSDLTDFGKYIKAVTGDLQVAQNATADLGEKVAGKAKDLGKYMDEAGRLNKKGMKQLEKAMGESGKSFSKALKAVQKDSVEKLGKINDAFGSFAKKIPIVGDKIAAGFEDMVKKNKLIARAMDGAIMRWNKMSAGGKTGVMAGGALALVAGGWLVKQPSEIY